jgi:hypothetical protein
VHHKRARYRDAEPQKRAIVTLNANYVASYRRTATARHRDAEPRQRGIVMLNRN